MFLENIIFIKTYAKLNLDQKALQTKEPLASFRRSDRKNSIYRFPRLKHFFFIIFVSVSIFYVPGLFGPNCGKHLDQGRDYTTLQSGSVSAVHLVLEKVASPANQVLGNLGNILET